MKNRTHRILDDAVSYRQLLLSGIRPEYYDGEESESF